MYAFLISPICAHPSRLDHPNSTWGTYYEAVCYSAVFVIVAAIVGRLLSNVTSFIVCGVMAVQQLDVP